jgi:hypothetical protein
MNTESVFYICGTILIILFYGQPDLMDVLMESLRK